MTPAAGLNLSGLGIFATNLHRDATTRRVYIHLNVQPRVPFSANFVTTHAVD